jgi:hypothetical protein
VLIGGVAFTFLVASFCIGTAACESAAKFSANLAVKTATTLCAPVVYDGDTNHFFVPAIAFEAPAGISSTVAIDALNRDQPRKALAGKDRAILGSDHRRPYPTLLIKPWRAVGGALGRFIQVVAVILRKEIRRCGGDKKLRLTSPLLVAAMRRNSDLAARRRA